MDDDLLDLPPAVVINEAVPVGRRFEQFLPHLDAMIVAAPVLRDRMRARFPGLNRPRARVPVYRLLLVVLLVTAGCLLAHRPGV